jgi:uncharacterized OB-fold protein
MTQWQHNVERLTLKGQISMPYTWTVGETGSRFLVALRDEQKIMGNHCPECATVFVPPRKNCGKCFKDIPADQWVELGREGVVTTFTTVRFSYPLQPAEAPFAYALIRLDGADVDFLHVIKKDLEKLENGARVKALFKKDRNGQITDIDAFVLV